jgi:hypothetical protein
VLIGVYLLKELQLKSPISILLLAILSLSCGKGKGGDSTHLSNCPACLAGVYSGIDLCTGASQSFYQTTVTVPSSNSIVIGNLYGITVTATVDCAHSSINIPVQSSGNFSIYGTGTFTANRISISWTGTESGHLPLSCNTTYTR